MSVKVPVNKGLDIEEGSYPVRCTRVWADRIENPQFGNGDVLKIKLEFIDLVDADNDPVEMEAMANFTLSPLSKLYGWATAFGCKVDLEADDFDAEEMLGKEALAVVTKKAKPDGSIWPRIDSIIPAPRRGVKAASATTSGAGTNLVAFWQKVRAVGKDTPDVLPYVNNDLLTLAEQPQEYLDTILKELGAI